MHLSQRAQTIQASPIRKLAPLMVEAKRRGRTILHLNIGQPDIATPAAYWEALKHFQDPVLSYGPSDGLPELKQAIVIYFARYDIALEPANILVTTGGSEAISFAFSAVGDYGDEVIIPEPFYTNYNGFASLAGLKVVPVTTHAENGFHLPDAAAVESAITPRTRAILICSPNNPTGTVATADEIEGLARIARKHDLFLIGDEVYKEFTYEDAVHTSLLQLAEVSDRVIVVDSVSKRFSACGARVGALISRNKEIMDAVLKFGQARLCPPTAEQVGAIAAYHMDPSYFAPIRQEYQLRRDTLLRGLRVSPEVLLRKPQGAFYMIVRLPLHDTDDFAKWLLTDWQVDGETVMVAPGEGFYATPGLGKNEIRVAYVLEAEKLDRAAKILVAGMEHYRKQNR